MAPGLWNLQVVPAGSRLRRALCRLHRPASRPPPGPKWHESRVESPDALLPRHQRIRKLSSCLLHRQSMFSWRLLNVGFEVLLPAVSIAAAVTPKLVFEVDVSVQSLAQDDIKQVLKSLSGRHGVLLQYINVRIEKLRYNISANLLRILLLFFAACF
ncbi:uncharacterized protein LY79DRAFT_195876 [Colletotrichum navitas]|uniref:Uncharacterized protein n=1 Tax=Colletotrichum navitas TaxID=681940 RepID=A0AAD8V4Y1_9PEZI|nr:uncharacterized protein LY79DRAFT_195876 [Colletotrichum navitas]KAK1590912.1 hypothetical protein LY79DRAFT_195876 [Colletotrichum navitas]